MKREYHRWYSHRLGLELGVVVYGHWGPPLLGFPTSAGSVRSRGGTGRGQRRQVLGRAKLCPSILSV